VLSGRPVDAPEAGQSTDLFFVVLYFNGFEIFGFENLPAVETLDVIDAIAPGNDLGSIVIAGGLHTTL